MKTIAVIDDDIYIGNMLEELLRGNGYDVLRAYSGTEAVLLLSQSKPELERYAGLVQQIRPKNGRICLQRKRKRRSTSYPSCMTCPAVLRN